MGYSQHQHLAATLMNCSGIGSEGVTSCLGYCSDSSWLARRSLDSSGKVWAGLDASMASGFLGQIAGVTHPRDTRYRCRKGGSRALAMAQVAGNGSPGRIR